MKILVILPTTLFETKFYPDVDKIIIWEHPYYFTKYKFNKKKLILHRASMKSYEVMVKKYFKSVDYIDFNQNPNLTTNTDNTKTDNTKTKITVVYFDPIDDLSDFQLGKKSNDLLNEAQILESPGFLLSKSDLESYYSSRKKNTRIIFNRFYKWGKKTTNIIPEIKSQDKHNRKKMPDDIKIKSFSIKCNKFVVEASKYVMRHFKDNYGSVDDFNYPIDHSSAVKLLKHFVKNLFKHFGDYQDFIDTKTKHRHLLFHTGLSSSINIGLITISEIISVLEKEYNGRSSIGLNDYEGLIRQYFWREYQRYCYIYRDSWISNDFFGNKKPLTVHWYNGTTGCKPVDDAIIDGFSTGYLHHIRRLMVMANYMNLFGINPYSAKQWFIEFAIDSYEWVMYQNVLDMGFFISGGKTMRKPYLTSSNYILKTSNYSRDDWCDIWDGLYRKFLQKHKKKLYKFRYHFPTLKY